MQLVKHACSYCFYICNQKVKPLKDILDKKALVASIVALGSRFLQTKKQK